MPPQDAEQARWFTEAVLPHEPAFRLYLRGKFPSLSAADIDDLVQEAYSRLLRARDGGPLVSVKAYLFVLGRNLALNTLRHRSYERFDAFTENDPRSVMDEGEFIPDALARAEEFKLLIQAIQSLPNRCRQIMTLRKIYGFSQHEVAARLHITENTVETHGSIGLRKCVEFFRRHGLGPRP